MKFFYMVISHYNNHTTNNTLFKKIESHEKVIPLYESKKIQFEKMIFFFMIFVF